MGKTLKIFAGDDNPVRMRTYYPRTKGFPWAQKRMAGDSESEIGPSGFSGEYGRFYSIKRGNMG